MRTSEAQPPGQGRVITRMPSKQVDLVGEGRAPGKVPDSALPKAPALSGNVSPFPLDSPCSEESLDELRLNSKHIQSAWD